MTVLSPHCYRLRHQINHLFQKRSDQQCKSWMKFYHGVLPSAFRYLCSFRPVVRVFSFGEFPVSQKVVRKINKKRHSYIFNLYWWLGVRIGSLDTKCASDPILAPTTFSDDVRQTHLHHRSRCPKDLPNQARRSPGSAMDRVVWGYGNYVGRQRRHAFDWPSGWSSYFAWIT